MFNYSGITTILQYYYEYPLYIQRIVDERWLKNEKLINIIYLFIYLIIIKII